MRSVSSAAPVPQALMHVRSLLHAAAHVTNVLHVLLAVQAATWAQHEPCMQVSQAGLPELRLLHTGGVPLSTTTVPESGRVPESTGGFVPLSRGGFVVPLSRGGFVVPLSRGVVVVPLSRAAVVPLSRGGAPASRAGAGLLPSGPA